MENYYSTNVKDQKDYLNVAKGMPSGINRRSWLATMAVHGEAGGDPDSADAVAHVIRNRREQADNKGKGTELWRKGFEEQINNKEWSSLTKKDKFFKDIYIKGPKRRKEFLEIDRKALYNRVDNILNNPDRVDPTEGRTFYIKRDRVDDNLKPKNTKGAGQQYFVKEFNSGNLFDPIQIGDHVFYRYDH